MVEAFQNAQAFQRVLEFAERHGKIERVLIFEMNRERADGFVTAVGVLVSCRESDAREFLIPKRREREDLLFGFSVFKIRRRLRKCIREGEHFVDGGNGRVRIENDEERHGKKQDAGNDK